MRLFLMALLLASVACGGGAATSPTTPLPSTQLVTFEVPGRSLKQLEGYRVQLRTSTSFCSSGKPKGFRPA